ncbi:hypothetical protein ACHQM5_024063 [Ranunculus cassubicifolius]
MADKLDYDACGSFGENPGLPFEEFLGGEMGSNYVQRNTPTISGLKSVCANSELFCFPSTLHAVLGEEGKHKVSSVDMFEIQDDPLEGNSSWLGGRGTYTLLNGNVVSCSFNPGIKPHDLPSSQGESASQSDSDSGEGHSLKYHRPFNILDKKSELVASDILDGSSSPKVDISPPFLDWGQSYLYYPSLAFLTVTNTCNESSMQIYKPFSTDTQFYPCDFDGIILRPGEVARICFVFLPQQLGLLSAQIVIQTNSGGFLIHAKGIVIESLYQIHPLVGLNVSLDGEFNRNLSLYNPFDDTLYIKEVNVWVSVSSENISRSAEAVCKMENFQSLVGHGSFLNIKEWLDIKSDQVTRPLLALRPHRSWEIKPHSTETIVEINFLSGSEGSVFGAFSVEVQTSSQDKSDMIVIPLQAEVQAKSAYSDIKGSVLVNLESLQCEGCNASVLLSLKNKEAYLLHVAKITEVTERKQIFHIKYMDGLLLYPDSVTQIGVITCPLNDSQEPPDGNADIHFTCRLLVLTNDSGNPQIQIPCQDVVQACSKHRPFSYIGHEHHEKSQSGRKMTESVGNVFHSPSRSSETEIEKLAEPDEEVLRNWRSQGTSRSGSVLDHEEVVYPVVQVGSYSSKWITVKNPSEQPVLMQLILNSGTVIDRCRSIEELEQPLSTGLVHNDSSRPSKHGFSIVATAKSEAYVHPHGEAQLGPILFHPSNRCGWRGSALIRNNLSGVEWISLKGVGGSFSLILLDDSSKTIKGLEFNLNIWDPVQISPKESLHFKENLTSSCSLSLSKEFRVMNTGDLASEVRKIEVSGTQCGLVDGFTVHTCDGFTLQPGESRTLRISYKTVFSSSIVHRDLELALTNGIFVIPMKASVPISMLNVCRKSFWRLLLKKLSLLVFVAACLAFIGFSFLLPKVTTVYKAQDCYLFKSENGTIRRATNNIITLKRAVRENETSKLGFVGRYSDCSNPSGSGVEEQTPRVVQDKVIGILEAETDTHLTVRVKSSKRRRKRRSGGNGSNAGKSGLLEVSSSQSGNSTPSSPMSPLLSFASRSTSTSWSLSPDSEHGIESSNPFCKTAIHNQVIKEKVSPRQKPSPTRKVPSKPVLLPSATFPSANQRVPDAVNAPQLLRSTSSINPNARAPGSNLRDRGVKREEKKDKFTYDIWGNHFSGIHLMDKAEEISTMMISDVSDGNSLSFFVMGPQILTRKSRDSSFPCTINSPRQNG